MTTPSKEQVVAEVMPEQPPAKAVSEKASAKPPAKVSKEKGAVKAKTPAKTSAKAPVKAPAKTSAKASAKIPVKTKKVVAKKPRLIRDSFTFPETEYALFATLKQQLLTAGKEVKKSELLRAGLAALAWMPTEQLLKTMEGVDKLKPGRPAK